MSCSSPSPWEDLVRYWAGDLEQADVDRLDEHLMGCGTCTAESARVSTIAQALHAIIPPVVSKEMLGKLRARGLRVEENTFAPGQGKTVVFGPEIDLLVHRLAGLDLSNAERVRVIVRVESTGEVLVEVPDAPFDAQEGVLIACQRHFSTMPPDTVFDVRAVEASGTERSAVYVIPHVFQELR